MSILLLYSSAFGSSSDWEVDSISRSMVRAKVKLRLSAYYSTPLGIEWLETARFCTIVSSSLVKVGSQFSAWIERALHIL